MPSDRNHNNRVQKGKCRRSNPPAGSIELMKWLKRFSFPNAEQQTRIPACYFRYSSFSPPNHHPRLDSLDVFPLRRIPNQLTHQSRATWVLCFKRDGRNNCQQKQTPTRPRRSVVGEMKFNLDPTPSLGENAQRQQQSDKKEEKKTNILDSFSFVRSFDEIVCNLISGTD